MQGGARAAGGSLIRETPAFRIASRRDATLGRAVVVVEARRPSAASALALRRLHAIHASASHPAVARAIAIDDTRVTLDCPAELDLAAVLRIAGPRGLRATHSEADGLVVTLRDGLRAGARTTTPDGATGVVGTLTYGNVLFDREGRFWLLGLGHNVVACDEHGALIHSEQIFQAPEVAVGGPATEGGDFVALLKMVRSLMSFVRLEPALARTLAGNSLREDAELVRRILWIERHVVSAAPSERASIAQTIRVSDRIRSLLGVWPDPEAFVQRARATIAGEPTEVAPPAPLRIERAGSFFERAGVERVELLHRPVLARLLAALARARETEAERILDVAALREAAWPGERMSATSGANRVYVAVNTLRRAGLGADLERYGRGYRLRPATAIELVGREHARSAGGERF